MGPALRDSNVGLIGICGRKFSRIATFAALIAVQLALSGCGGDDESDATTPAATTPTETATTESTPTETSDQEPAVTETESDTEAEAPESPEDMPGGGGDEEPARTPALLTGRGGRIIPRVVRVPAFIAVKVELRSADGATYGLRFGDTKITAGGQLHSVSTTLDGLRPGEAVVGRPTGGGDPVRIEATAEPGP
jgi:hypothetical protein